MFTSNALQVLIPLETAWFSPFPSEATSLTTSFYCGSSPLECRTAKKYRLLPVIHAVQHPSHDHRKHSVLLLAPGQLIGVNVAPVYEVSVCGLISGCFERLRWC